MFFFSRIFVTKTNLQAKFQKFIIPRRVFNNIYLFSFLLLIVGVDSSFNELYIAHLYVPRLGYSSQQKYDVPDGPKKYMKRDKFI